MYTIKPEEHVNCCNIFCTVTTMTKQSLLGRGAGPLEQLPAVEKQKLQELEERLFERLQSLLLQALQDNLSGQQLPPAATTNATRGVINSHPAPTPSATVANLLGLTPSAPPGSRLLPFLSEINAGHIHTLIAHKVLDPTQNNPNAANNTTVNNTPTIIDQTALIGSTGTVTVTGSFPSGYELRVDLAGSTFNGHILLIPNPSSASTASDPPNDNNKQKNQQREQEDQPFFSPPVNKHNNNVNLQPSIDTHHHHQQQQQTMGYSVQMLPDNAVGHNNNRENRVNNEKEEDAPGAVKRRRIDTCINDNLIVEYPAGGEKTSGKPTTATGAADGGEGGAEPSPFPPHLSHLSTQHQQQQHQQQHHQVKSPQDPVTSFELWKTYHVGLMRKKMAIDQNGRNSNKTNGDGKEKENEEQVLERMLKEKWHSMNDKDKNIYEVLAQEDEKRWECEMQAYLAGMRAHVEQHEQGGGFGGQMSLLLGSGGSGGSGGGGTVTTNTNVGVFIQSLPPGAPVVPQ